MFCHYFCEVNCRDCTEITARKKIPGHSCWTVSVHYHYIDGLVQGRRNSCALAMTLRLSCTNPSICSFSAWDFGHVNINCFYFRNQNFRLVADHPNPISDRGYWHQWRLLTNAGRDRSQNYTQVRRWVSQWMGIRCRILLSCYGSPSLVVVDCQLLMRHGLGLAGTILSVIG